MAISKIKCWHTSGAIFDIEKLSQKPVTLELVKKSMLKSGYRAYCLTERKAIEQSDWYANYQLNDKIFFYIEGSGLFKLVNIDLVENEFYFEKSNLPSGYKPWIFYSWQSDHNPSRSHIKSGIEAALSEINKRNPRYEIEILESTRTSDGSANIVESIQKNIDRSLYCVFDITNIVSLDSGDPNSKSYPNSNVSYELGYAQNRKKENQVLLVKKKRNSDFSNDSTPFDFDQKLRIEYTAPAELKIKIKTILINYFKEIGFID